MSRNRLNSHQVAEHFKHLIATCLSEAQESFLMSSAECLSPESMSDNEVVRLMGERRNYVGLMTASTTVHWLRFSNVLQAC